MNVVESKYKVVNNGDGLGWRVYEDEKDWGVEFDSWQEAMTTMKQICWYEDVYSKR